MDEVFETDSGVDVTARQQSVDHIMKILRELTPEEAYIFDRADAVSDISELSDPFVEMAEHRPKPKPKVEEKVDFSLSQFCKNLCKSFNYHLSLCRKMKKG